MLWAGLNISTGITSYNSHNFCRFNESKVFIYISLAMITSFILLAINQSFFGLFFVLIIYLLRGIVTPLLRNAINSNTNSNIRATVLSIRSFLIRISFSILAPFLAYVSDNYCLSYTFYTLAIMVAWFSILSSIKLINLSK